MVEHLLNMPDAGPREGSSTWINTMKTNLDLVTFEHMSRYPELLRAWIRDEIQKAKKDEVDFDLIKLRHGEAIPNTLYDPSHVHVASLLKETRRLMEYHPNLEFLRAGAAKYALEKLRDDALIPRT